MVRVALPRAETQHFCILKLSLQLAQALETVSFLEWNGLPVVHVFVLFHFRGVVASACQDGLKCAELGCFGLMQSLKKAVLVLGRADV